MNGAALPRISVAALGGTIAMRAAPGRDGVVPTLTADSLVGGIPELREVARIDAVTLSNLPSASLTPAAVLEAVDWASSEVQRSQRGVVITQGTDTLEETSYLASLVWDRDEPLVFTGAMRSPAQPSADGPANLIAACRVAGSASARGLGVLLVMDDDIHEARWAQKTHSTALDSFRSPPVGPLGHVVEHRVRLHRPATPGHTVARPTSDPYVPVLETHLGDEGATLRAIREFGADGVVIAAFGAGHVSAAMARGIEVTARSIPVVVSSRTQAGGTLTNTYGFEGSEIDLARRGAILSGSLDPRKSRILLWALLGAGTPSDGLPDAFRRAAGAV